MFPFKILKKSISRVTISTLGPKEASSDALLRPLRKYILYSIVCSLLLFFFVLFLGKHIVLFALGPKWVLPDFCYKLLACLVSFQVLSGQLMNQVNILSKSFAYSSRLYLVSLMFLLSMAIVLYFMSSLQFHVFLMLLLVSEIFKSIMSFAYAVKYSSVSCRQNV